MWISATRLNDKMWKTFRIKILIFRNVVLDSKVKLLSSKIFDNRKYKSSLMTFVDKENTSVLFKILF